MPKDLITYAVTLVAALAVAALATLTGIPAGALIGSTLAVVAIAALGQSVGLPNRLRDLAFALTGAALSARMSRMTAEQAKRYAVAGLSIVATSLVMSFVFALIAQSARGLTLGQFWLAYAPGGVEAMAAIGLSLGDEPAYVALHHFARIFALLLIAPIALRL